MPTPRLTAAFELANRLHAEQTRKGTAVPYISHLMGVAALVLEDGGDEDAAIVALLHDAVEDQGGQATLDLIRAECHSDRSRRRRRSGGICTLRTVVQVPRLRGPREIRSG